ncbi:NAD(+) ADP-ribosyltransferase [Bertholletia excelsa]
MPLSVPGNGGKRVLDSRAAQLLTENYSNFQKSSPPFRVMFYDGCSWTDFEGAVVDSLRAGFQDGKAMVEFEDGKGRYIFDMHRMVQVDLQSGNQRSIAWIDVNGKCFFPWSFIDGGGNFDNVVARGKQVAVMDDCQDLNLEISSATKKLESKNPKIIINVGGNVNPDKRKNVCVEIKSGEDVKDETEGSASNNQTVGAKRLHLVTDGADSPRWPGTKPLREEETVYAIIKNVFKSALVIAEPGAKITTIHQCLRSHPLYKARQEIFDKQKELITAARGEDNIVLAWHGTSAEGVASILNHGLFLPRKIQRSEAHGVGIYFSPACSPHISAMLCDADANGEKHLILCKILLGKCEKVEAGSVQMYPSGTNFDNAVNDLETPTWYVVWWANMKTHVLPEYVVSYKSSDLVAGQSRGLSLVQSISVVPSPLMAKVLSELEKSLPSARFQEIQTFYNAYKDQKVTAAMFMDRLRSIVGEENLNSLIDEVRSRE